MNQLEPHELKRVLNQLEQACHAGFNLMLAKEITPEQYDRLNDAIWRVENEIKGDE